MNHKRHRPKNQRAGCLMCKPWKANGAKINGGYGGRRASERRQLQRDPETEAELLRLAGEVAGRTRTPEQAEADLQRLASTLAAFND